MPLLSLREEINLGKTKDLGIVARLALERDMESSRKRMGSRQREQYERQVLEGKQAKDTFVLHNIRLVVSIVMKKYRWAMTRMEPEDLVQEGIAGLAHAARKYDHRRGYKFSTYATWWIRQSVSRAIADQGRTIRVPVHMGDQLRHILKLSRQMTQEFHRSPTPDELAEAMGISVKKLESILRWTQSTISLESTVVPGGDRSLEETLVDPESSPENEVAYKLLHEEIAALLFGMPPREARILKLRYGLFDGKSYTLDEVGEKMGVTRERVRQIEAKALDRLRHPDRSRGLKEYLR